MRTRISPQITFALALAIAALRCGQTVSGDDAGTDGATDGSNGDGSKLDGASDAPDNDAADAHDGGGSEGGIVISLKCAEGTQCDAGAPICCATLQFGANCKLAEVSATCTDSVSCPTSFQPFCGGNELVRLCDQNADCTEPSYDKCCTFQNGKQSLVFCANQAIANAADASCVQ